ncbi:hypothetical protein IKP13_01960 [bacterium]|nr:hypothetical protein [bacterium]
MKKILLALLMVSTAFFTASCADEEEVSNLIGGTCSVEGEEACSADSAQILICRDASWQAKKNCNLNFGEYCRQTADGVFSCKDSGGSNPSDPADSEDPSDNLPDSSDDLPDENNTPETDTEPEDDTDSTPDNETDTEPNDADTDTEPEDTTPIETCAGIFACQNNCTTTECSTQCYTRGTTEAQNDFYAWRECRTSNNNNISEILKDEDCKESMIKCGEVGDMTYSLPYGHAIVKTSIPYLYSEADIDSEGNISINFNNSAATFITGNFGNSGNIVNPAAQGTYAFAFTNTQEHYITLNQNYQGNTAYNPTAKMVITATEPGTYTVGLGSNDKVSIFINEIGSNGEIACTHAFGFGSITIAAIGYTPGATTISISESEIDLFSYKNAPMYVGKDISDDGDWKACQPK